MKLTNLDKEMVLLSIIADMKGGTDASDSPHSWLNWFCNDEVHGQHSDTFNRCIEKGWLRSSHDTSFDTSTAWLTDAGKAALAGEHEEDADTLIAIEICDAVLQWIVKHDLGQQDDEFTASDVTSILDDLWGDEEDQPGDPKAAEAVLRRLID